ncbi:hypothetical protein [Actinopolymorpha singaporensis]|uniref:hypothetical protein n=1 Tax=Actinopolymorpha singaporensis TaxID=117157 RepID=UPI0012FDD7A1|nr:hypothetical protein [Actinopolymorpha singaporensis]
MIASLFIGNLMLGIALGGFGRHLRLDRGFDPQVLLRSFHRVPDRLGPGEQDEAVLGQHLARGLQRPDRARGVPEGLQEQDPVEQPASEPRHRRQIGQIALDKLDARRTVISLRRMVAVSSSADARQVSAT